MNAHSRSVMKDQPVIKGFGPKYNYHSHLLNYEKLKAFKIFDHHHQLFFSFGTNPFCLLLNSRISLLCSKKEPVYAKPAPCACSNLKFEDQGEKCMKGMLKNSGLIWFFKMFNFYDFSSFRLCCFLIKSYEASNLLDQSFYLKTILMNFIRAMNYLKRIL